MAERPPTLCLLPGLDGSGRLYRSLIEQLSDDFRLRVLAYDRHRFSGYEALSAQIARQLPTATDFVLVAESFAGPLAVMLARQRPAGLRALVLAASFLGSPVLASRALAVLVERMPSILPPGLLLERWLAGRGADPALRNELERILKDMPLEVLRQRALSALRSDTRALLSPLELPLLYLQGTRDRLIGPRAGREVMRHARQGELRRIDAPHFLFQVAAAPAAAAIRDFLRRHRIG